uniref:Uncharacterized protein n=1 Tax=Oryza punctata TaxID=4537 RepID=A0A0E0JJV6_ORYPU
MEESPPRPLEGGGRTRMGDASRCTTRCSPASGASAPPLPSAYEDAIWVHFHRLPSRVDSGLIDALGFNAVVRIDYQLWNLMASLGFNAVVSVRVSNEIITPHPPDIQIANESAPKI